MGNRFARMHHQVVQHLKFFGSHVNRFATLGNAILHRVQLYVPVANLNMVVIVLNAPSAHRRA